MKLLTYTETIQLLVRQYPDLYWGKTWDDMKWNVSEHVFNVIGAGFNDKDGIKCFLDNEYSRNLLNDKSMDFLFEGKQIYQIREPGFSVGKSLFSLDDKNLPPNTAAYKVKGKRGNLYPNFQEDYSFFYSMKEENLLKYFDITWFEGLRDYYKEARELINGEGKYDVKPPKDLNSAEWQHTVSMFKKSFEKYEKESTSLEECYKTISKDYEHPYDGDLNKFLTTRWQKESIRINMFIDQTLTEIEREIEERIVAKSKQKKRI